MICIVTGNGYLCLRKRFRKLLHFGKSMATINDIAKRTGISIGTISKVLTGAPEFSRISAPTVRKIRLAAKTLGYQANQNARALAKQKSMTLGVYIAPHPGERITSLYVSPILEGICEAARENRYDILLIDVGNTDQELRRTLEKYHAKRVDGVIIVNFHGSPQLIESIQATKMPLVAVDNFAYPSLPCVNLDNKAGITLAVRHLYDLGHRRLAFLSELGEPSFPDHVLRKTAFLETVRRLGIEKNCVVTGPPLPGPVVKREGPYCQEDGYRGTGWLLEQQVGFTALVGYNDLVALGALRRLNEAGIRVPGHVSLTGFDNNSASAYLSPPLTTVSHPLKSMGRQAVQILLHSLMTEGRAVSSEPILVQPELVIRESTGPVPPAGDGHATCRRPRVTKAQVNSRNTHEGPP